jgi:choline kinase
MCGGEYKIFQTPKHLSVINGERLVDRTIRLLKENGVKDIYISSNNPIFDTCGVPRLEHTNTYVNNGKSNTGYWLDAFYKVNEPVCYIWGDVYFTDNAIKTIVNYKTNKNIFFGTSDALNEYHNNWGEPFAYIVNDYITFYKGIDDVKKLKDEGKCIREPVVWELYRYLHGLDINVQRITTDYVCIDDGTMDVDSPKELEELKSKLEK